ncbi:DUF2442 domain-containing protein, partial [Pseudomonas viridiflava]|uniref:DUF2442 domain-containing protein n=1 Tax=Pseudomonas viridiflava TaxID=33069 RepID=UPI001F15250F
NSGVELAIPPGSVEGLSDVRPDQLDNIEVSPSGLGLHSPELHADLYVPALLKVSWSVTRGWRANWVRKAGHELGHQDCSVLAP